MGESTREHYYEPDWARKTIGSIAACGIAQAGPAYPLISVRQCLRSPARADRLALQRLTSLLPPEFRWNLSLAPFSGKARRLTIKKMGFGYDAP